MGIALGDSVGPAGHQRGKQRPYICQPPPKHSCIRDPIRGRPTPRRRYSTAHGPRPTAYSQGSVTWKAAPPPGALAALIVPPCASITARLI